MLLDLFQNSSWSIIIVKEIKEYCFYREEMCDAMLPWKQNFWISTIIFLDRHGWPCIVKWWKENTSHPFIPKRNNAQKIFCCCFFPTILAGPRFVETQKFCYHGSVTSPFFYTVGSNSWLGKILDQIITWGKIHLNWRKMKFDETCMHRLVWKRTLRK